MKCVLILLGILQFRELPVLLVESAGGTDMIVAKDAKPSAGLDASDDHSPSFLRLERRIRKSTVGIRVSSRKAASDILGLGTVIAEKRDRVFAVTCAHLFRDSRQVFMSNLKGDIVERRGTLKFVDHDRNLAVISFRRISGIRPAKLNRRTRSENDQAAYFKAIRGTHGKLTCHRTKIVGQNWFVGPSNFVTSGTITTGSYGGGLFDRHGSLTAVSTASLPEEHQGLFVSVETFCLRTQRFQTQRR